ncbi:two-component system LytT family response regulator [Pedobacter sp. AK017]|uniref:LytR/AlgR family response regulator transcription factor n=1 Tax=Pedobacter sp. AK017 TaxID=2723073 RepID=UPI001610A3E2|nr:LytTR family DNA-binding domain-containing protein [Pedobacter sp. AK017]MBB5437790.1 two-component system LytT family response regulator [Pedobacter sp. AK017]
MKVLIVEDEVPAAQRLQALLTEYGGITVLEVLPSIESTIKWLQKHPLPDLIFLDIHLSDGLSFEIFKQTTVKCPVIFCTAYDQYALDAFQLHSIDYILKPIQYNKLYKSLEKMKDIRQSFSSVSDPIQMNDIVSMIRKGEASYKSRFMVKSGAKIKTIKTDDVAYFYSHNKLSLLVTRQGEKFPIDYALDELIQMLNPGLFFHVNRKLIIHVDAAKEIHPYFKGRLKLVLQPAIEEEVIVSSQKTPAFKEWLDQ